MMAGFDPYGRRGKVELLEGGPMMVHFHTGNNAETATMARRLTPPTPLMTDYANRYIQPADFILPSSRPHASRRLSRSRTASANPQLSSLPGQSVPQYHPIQPTETFSPPLPPHMHLVRMEMSNSQLGVGDRGRDRDRDRDWRIARGNSGMEASRDHRVEGLLSPPLPPFPTKKKDTSNPNTELERKSSLTKRLRRPSQPMQVSVQDGFLSPPLALNRPTSSTALNALSSSTSSSSSSSSSSRSTRQMDARFDAFFEKVAGSSTTRAQTTSPLELLGSEMLQARASNIPRARARSSSDLRVRGSDEEGSTSFLDDTPKKPARTLETEQKSSALADLENVARTFVRSRSSSNASGLTPNPLLLPPAPPSPPRSQSSLSYLSPLTASYTSASSSGKRRSRSVTASASTSSTHLVASSPSDPVSPTPDPWKITPEVTSIIQSIAASSPRNSTLQAPTPSDSSRTTTSAEENCWSPDQKSRPCTPSPQASPPIRDPVPRTPLSTEDTDDREDTLLLSSKPHPSHASASSPSSIRSPMARPPPRPPKSSRRSMNLKIDASPSLSSSPAPSPTFVGHDSQSPRNFPAQLAEGAGLTVQDPDRTARRRRSSVMSGMSPQELEANPSPTLQEPINLPPLLPSPATLVSSQYIVETSGSQLPWCDSARASIVYADAAASDSERIGIASTSSEGPTDSDSAYGGHRQSEEEAYDEQWARDRRLSKLFSGLGLALTGLGNTSQDPPSKTIQSLEPSVPEESIPEQSEWQAEDPRYVLDGSDMTEDSASSPDVDSDEFQSAEEGEEEFWAADGTAISEDGATWAQAEDDSALSTMSTISTLRGHRRVPSFRDLAISAEPAEELEENPSTTESRRVSVAYGYAVDLATGSRPESVHELVRQSWRFSQISSAFQPQTSPSSVSSLTGRFSPGRSPKSTDSPSQSLGQRSSTRMAEKRRAFLGALHNAKPGAVGPSEEHDGAVSSSVSAILSPKTPPTTSREQFPDVLASPFPLPSPVRKNPASNPPAAPVCERPDPLHAAAGNRFLNKRASASPRTYLSSEFQRPALRDVDEYLPDRNPDETSEGGEGLGSDLTHVDDRMVAQYPESPARDVVPWGDSSLSPERIRSKDRTISNFQHLGNAASQANPPEAFEQDSWRRDRRERGATAVDYLAPCTSTGMGGPESAPLTSSPALARTWRSTLSAEEYDDFLKRYGPLEMRRQEVVWELCETEASFVSGMRGVIRVFCLPLRTPQGTWIRGVPAPVARLLDWLDDIVHLHCQITAALQDARSLQSPLVARIAEIFLPYVARLEVHQPYLVRFDKVTKSIDEMSANPDSDFGEFVRMQSSLPECGSMTLSSFLLKPVQRLMKYPLFFKQLCDLTLTSHPDHLATLSLLHSTDSSIRVMQEVKAREEEYERTKDLQNRFKGLPEHFRLARRDRRLLCHGLLRRVHISEKDRAALQMDAMATLHRSPAHLSSLSKLSPISLHPYGRMATFRPEHEARPLSEASDSASSAVSSASMSQQSDTSMSSWSVHSAGRPFLTPSTTNGSIRPNSVTSSCSELRPDSMVSSTSTAFSELSNFTASSAASYAARQSRKRTTSTGRFIKTKAKETPVHAFVFSDMIVFATRHTEGIRLIRGTRSSYRKKDDHGAYYKLVEGFGLSRVLGISDLSGKTEHDHLIEVELLPIASESPLVPMPSAHPTLATTIYLTMPDRLAGSKTPSSSDALLKEKTKWVSAIEKSLLFALRSLSFPSPARTPSTLCEDRASCASFLAAGLPLPKSPSEQFADKDGSSDNDEADAEEEREERGWWATRLKRVKKEMLLAPLEEAAAQTIGLDGGFSTTRQWEAREARANLKGLKDKRKKHVLRESTSFDPEMLKSRSHKEEGRSPAIQTDHEFGGGGAMLQAGVVSRRIR